MPEMLDFCSPRQPQRTGRARIRAGCGPTVEAYLDDSGTHAGSQVSIVAGYMGMAEAWESLERRWSAVLDGGHVRFFHASAAAHFRRPFDGWTARRRDTLIRKLIDVINDTPIIGIGSALPAIEHRSFMPQEKLRRQVDAYTLNIYNALSILCEHAAAEHPGVPIGVTVERKPKSDGKVRAAFEALKRTNRWPLASLTIMEKAQRGALQCADLLAYETYLAAQERGRPHRGSFVALFRNRLTGTILDNCGLLALILNVGLVSPLS